MRCKVGDLCVIVNSTLGNKGVLVRVVGPSEMNRQDVDRVFIDGHWWQSKTPDFKWHVESLGRPLNGKLRSYPARGISDKNLRPLRDDEGTDETLTWAGLPSQIKETV